MTPDPFDAARLAKIVGTDSSHPMLVSYPAWRGEIPFYKRILWWLLGLLAPLRRRVKPTFWMSEIVPPEPPCYGNHQWSDWRESTLVIGEKWRRCQREGCHVVGFIVLPGAPAATEVVWDKYDPNDVPEPPAESYMHLVEPGAHFAASGQRVTTWHGSHGGRDHYGFIYVPIVGKEFLEGG